MKFLLLSGLALSALSSVLPADDDCVGDYTSAENPCVSCTAVGSASISNGEDCGGCPYSAAGTVTCNYVDPETGQFTQSISPYTGTGTLSCGQEKRVKMPCPGGGSIIVVAFTCTPPVSGC